MDPKVWGKLLTLHHRGYDDIEALRDDGPRPAELRNMPQDGISWIQKAAAVDLGFWLPFWPFGGMCVYIGGRSTPEEHRGAHEAGGHVLGGRPHPRDRLFCSLEQGPSLLDNVGWENHVPERFYSVWTPFDIPFLRNIEIGKKNNNSRLGLRLIG